MYLDTYQSIAFCIPESALSAERQRNLSQWERIVFSCKGLQLPRVAKRQ